MKKKINATKTIVLDIVVSNDKKCCAKDCAFLGEKDSGQDTYPSCWIFGILDGSLDKPKRAPKCVRAESKSVLLTRKKT